MTRKGDPRGAGRRRAGGFTLLEVVIAISILAVIVIIVYGSLSQIIRSKRLLDDGRDMQRVANSLLIRMCRELQLVPRRKPLPNLIFPAGGTTAGKKGVSFIGEEKSFSGSRRGDSVTFKTLNGGQYLPGGGVHTGIVQITYRVAPDPEGGGGDSGNLWLIREEIPDLQPEKLAFEQAMVFPVAKNVVSLRFRYHDPEGQTWVDAWDDSRGTRMPDMVQFFIELKSPLDRVESFVSTVSLK